MAYFIAIVLMLTISLPASISRAGNECQNIAFNGTHAVIGHLSSNECYNISISSNVTGKGYVYLNLNPNNTLGSNGRITVYNINKGNASLVSNRSLNDRPGSYLVVGFSNVEAKDNTEVVRVSINIGEVKSTTNVAALLYKTSCDLTWNNTDLWSPDYQTGTASDMLNCTYTLKPDSSVSTYSFTSFRMSKSASITLIKDTGESWVYNGGDLPGDIIPVNYSLQMHLNTSLGDSFYAAGTTQTTSCTYEVILNGSSHMEVTSPGFPANYQPSLDCKVVIKTTNSSWKLRFDVLNSSLSSDHTSVLLIDGGASYNSMNRSIAYIRQNIYQDFPLLSSKGQVLLRFRTGELGTDQGFRINVTVIDAGGLFYSPANISLDSSSNVTSALFHLKTLPGSQMMINVFNLTSPNSTVVCKDVEYSSTGLRIKDIALYRPGFLLYTSYSSNQKVVCQVQSLTKGVFMASVTTVPTGFYYKFSDGVGDFFSLPASRPSNQTYEWIIQPSNPAPSDSVIELIISKLTQSNSPGDLRVKVETLNNKTYDILTQSTTLPYNLRGDVADGIRLTVDGGSASSSLLDFEAGYSLESSSSVVTQQSGAITSPYYPFGFVKNVVQRWTFNVRANTSLLLSFDTLFCLPNAGVLSISVANRSLLLLNGTKVVPEDLLINSTNSNTSLVLSINYTSSTQSQVAGFKINYKTLNFGQSINLAGEESFNLSSPMLMRNQSFQAVWIVTYPSNASYNLFTMTANVTFKPDNFTQLIIRDGASASSEMIENISQYVNSSANSLFIEYSYQNATNSSSAAPFHILIKPITCSTQQQCKNRDNVTVCIKPEWLCDNIYHCLDGRDELDCHTSPATPTPSTAAPQVNKEGIKAWVLGVSVFFAFVGGVIIAIIGVAIIMRRRGMGYTRLSELMTPVPT